jgi:hypothetical protein
MFRVFVRSYTQSVGPTDSASHCARTRTVAHARTRTHPHAPARTRTHTHAPARTPARTPAFGWRLRLSLRCQAARPSGGLLDGHARACARELLPVSALHSEECIASQRFSVLSVRSPAYTSIRPLKDAMPSHQNRPQPRPTHTAPQLEYTSESGVHLGLRRRARSRRCARWSRWCMRAQSVVETSSGIQFSHSRHCFETTALLWTSFVTYELASAAERRDGSVHGHRVPLEPQDTVNTRWVACLGFAVRLPTQRRQTLQCMSADVYSR